MKSTRMMEFRTMMPAPAMKPIMEVAVKKAPISQCAGQDAHQRQRDRRHDDQRRDEGLEPADDEDVDQHQHHREGDAQVAEDLVGDVPLAVPLHRELLGRERLCGAVLLDARSLPARAAASIASLIFRMA